jgi:hypothetical protein
MCMCVSYQLYGKARATLRAVHVRGDVDGGVARAVDGEQACVQAVAGAEYVRPGIPRCLQGGGGSCGVVLVLL